MNWMSSSSYLIWRIFVLLHSEICWGCAPEVIIDFIWDMRYNWCTWSLKPESREVLTKQHVSIINDVQSGHPSYFWGLVSFHSLSWFVHGIFLIIYFGFLCLLTWSTDSQTLLWPGSDAGQTKLRQGCRGGYAIKLHVFKVETISKNGANAKKWTFTLKQWQNC